MTTWLPLAIAAIVVLTITLWPLVTRHRAWALGLAVALTIGAMTVYRMTGAPGLPDQPIAMREAVRLGMEQTEFDNIVALTKQTEDYLADNPDDAQGWALLARTYRQMERVDGALRAYRRAAMLDTTNATLQADYGEVAMAAAGGTVTPEAENAFVTALQALPEEPRARFYLGVSEAQAGNLRGALAIWQDLKIQSTDDAPWLPALTRQMDQAAATLDLDLAEVPPIHPLTLRATEDSGRDGMIRAMVSRLAARLQDEPDDIDGWLQLGRSYAVLEDYDGAISAYESAVEQAPERAEEIWATAAANLPEGTDAHALALQRATATPDSDT